jgi:uncharacterized protein YcbK (DUF882 family)
MADRRTLIESSHPMLNPDRRQVLNGLAVGALAAGGLLMPGQTLASVSVPAVRKLSLNNLHTGEVCRVVFQENGAFDPDALAEINHILRDHRTGEVAEIDPNLLSLLSDLRRQLGSKRPLAVISGYRSPKSNAMLAAQSGGVAKRSYHMRGMAIDCRMPDVSLKHLHKAALKARRGGVGLYTRSGFVHIDIGPVRTW